MGTVDLAYDLRRDHLVALKRALIRTQGETSRRFEDEQAISKKLNHPNMVTVYDAGVHANRLYLAMQWVSGKNLEEVQERARQQGGVLPPTVVCAILRQLCSALTYAHELPELGFVHRDISAANILIGYDGTVRLIDYGLAWFELKQEHTQPGGFVGNAVFAAPEQMTTFVIDARSDVFALGAVGWYLLSGQPPRNQWQSAADPLPNVSSVADVDIELDDLISRATAQKPENRFQSMREFAAALDAYSVAHEGISSTQLATWIEGLFPGAHHRAENEQTAFVVSGRSIARLSPVSSTIPSKPRQIRRNFFTAKTIWLVLAILVAISTWLLIENWPRHPATQQITTDIPKNTIPVQPSAPEPATSPAPIERRAPNHTHGLKHPKEHQSVTLRAEEAFRQKDYATAIELANESIKLGGGTAPLLIRANVWLRQKNWAAAEKDFKKVLSLDPKNAEARDGLSLAHSLK